MHRTLILLRRSKRSRQKHSHVAQCCSPLSACKSACAHPRSLVSTSFKRKKTPKTSRRCLNFDQRASSSWVRQMASRLQQRHEVEPAKRRKKRSIAQLHQASRSMGIRRGHFCHGTHPRVRRGCLWHQRCTLIYTTRRYDSFSTTRIFLGNVVQLDSTPPTVEGPIKLSVNPADQGGSLIDLPPGLPDDSVGYFVATKIPPVPLDV